MIYLLISVATFISDFFVKRHMDRKYARYVRHPRLNGHIILEKHYNQGVTLNFLENHPAIVRGLHTFVMLIVGIYAYPKLRAGHPLEKTGLALLLGGGASNLYDRYTQSHVVDYFHINIGPKWLRNIIFNLSDFAVFLGALLAVAGNS